MCSPALFSQTSQGRIAEIEPRWERNICSWLVSTSAVNTFLCSKYLIRLLPAVFDICPTSFANPTYLRIRSLYKFHRLMLAQILQDCSIEPVLKGQAVNAEQSKMFVNYPFTWMLLLMEGVYGDTIMMNWRRSWKTVMLPPATVAVTLPICWYQGDFTLILSVGGHRFTVGL